MDEQVAKLQNIVMELQIRLKVLEDRVSELEMDFDDEGNGEEWE